MSDFISELLASPLLADGAYGSFLFERTGRLSEANHVYEALNLANPDVIRDVHLAYLQAGARCLTTNTFGANSAYLTLMGEQGRVAEINRAGVQRAREAIDRFKTQTGSDKNYFVISSIGPSSDEELNLAQVREIYLEQIEALIAADVDALMLETFSCLAQVKTLLELINTLPDAPPVMVQMTLKQQTDGDWNIAPVTYVETIAALGAKVIGVNCCTPWDATAFVEQAGVLDVVRSGKVLLSAMPNAGGFQRIGHRFMTAVNPEFMGKLARSFSAQGVRLIGGCCEVHPEHIREMNNYLQGSQVGHRSVEVTSRNTLKAAGPEEKAKNGPFSRKLMAGEFVVSVEMLPSRGTGASVLQHKIDFVKELADSGLADALDITDGSRGIPLMPPGDFIACIRENLGWRADGGDKLELIPHYTTRDLNVMGLQSRLMGYYARRINNVLYITGDPPKMSPSYPRSTAVFDANSVDMVKYTQGCLNAGVDFGGQLLGKHGNPQTHFTIGSGFEPEAVDSKTELQKLESKIHAGADYLMTQPVFRNEALSILDPYRNDISVLVGVMVLTGLEHAKRVGQVPGVTIPDSVFERLAKFDSLEDQALAGRDIAMEQICWVKEQGWSGLYLMSPASHDRVIETLGAIQA